MKIAWDGVCCPDLMARQTAVEERPSLLLPGLSIFLLQLITRVRLIFLKTSVLLILLRNTTRLRRLETEGSTSLEVEHLANFSFSSAGGGFGGFGLPEERWCRCRFYLVPGPTTNHQDQHLASAPPHHAATSVQLWRLL